MPRRPSAPRSRLLAVVYLISLAVLLILGGGLAILASAHVSSAALGASAAADRALGEGLLAELGPLAVEATPDRAERDRMRGVLERAVDDVGLLGLAVVAPDGRLRASAGAIDGRVSLPPDVGAGQPAAKLITGEDATRLYEWFPVSLDGRTVAVLQVVRDGTGAVATAAAAQRDIALAAAGGSTVLIIVLFVIFRGAERRLDRQTAQLLESTRRDPLTGHLTHGAVVAELTASLDAGAQPVSVALLDVDNFRQLNDTHGHDLGDSVIRRVASILDADRPGSAAIGRSGPDEFLVTCAGTDAQSLATWLEEARRRLASDGVDTASGEELPLTVSAGIAVAPLHGRTATELLSSAAMSLGEAQSGGGDQVLISRLPYAELVQTRRASFSILDGLVNAIDARDRYTRHHSEDVARYALFLARQLDFDDTMTSALHQAALLHDVGKIAVPDDVLRKPGALTSDEMEVIKQHVVLGAVLVRDLADADLVVDGVRHHHERWDGTGYPDGLEAERIPLIARVLSVADTFSAMTTTRPYRRALSPAIGLQRLAEAAGSQLEPRLVDVFILAMESQAEAPVPSDARPPSVWLSEGTAA
ncbi:MAG TPA: diguanylate cyclase [Egibacteraceae bacterium]|nr:diguanylate cyclase [Egibacteraceae bacterium]